MKSEVVGYITSDYLSSGFIPHSMQNLLIREYLKKLNFNFALSWTEYKNKAPIVLNSLLQENFYQGICFFSVEQLLYVPNMSAVVSKLKDKNIWIGFAFENISFHDNETYIQFEKFLKIKKLIKNNIQTLNI